MEPDDAIIVLLLIELCPALSCVPTTVRRRKLIERFGRALIKTSAPRPAAKWNWDESVLPSIAIRLINDATVEMALKGKNAVMPVIVRKSAKPYRWSIGEAPLSAVANQEKKVPRHYITADGFGVTTACRNYLAPLIHGEDHPPYSGGLPVYVTLRGAPVRKRLKDKFSV